MRRCSPVRSRPRRLRSSCRARSSWASAALAGWRGPAFARRYDSGQFRRVRLAYTAGTRFAVRPPAHAIPGILQGRYMPQVIGVPRETVAGEKRIATVPEAVEKRIKLGFKVAVQSGAGEAANFSDDAYRAAGAEIVGDAPALWARSDIVFKVRAPAAEEVGLLREGQALISFVWPAQNPELMQKLAARKAT